VTLASPRAVLVLDDDAAARDWLQAAVRQAFPDAELAAAGSLREARVALRTMSPDLALVDLDLPDGSGVSLIELLARPPHRTISIVSTVFADDQHLFPALRAGAAGYLLKDESIERLAELLRQTMQGKPPLSAPIATRLLGYFHEPDAPATISLTQREQEVHAQHRGELHEVALSQARGHQPRRGDARGDTARADPALSRRAQPYIDASSIAT
jgi:DNA-binding NarL/FixJ family response regulator